MREDKSYKIWNQKNGAAIYCTGDNCKRNKFNAKLQFNLGLVKFELPVRHSAGDVEQAVGYTSLNFRGEVWAGVNVRVIQ